MAHIALAVSVAAGIGYWFQDREPTPRGKPEGAAAATQSIKLTFDSALVSLRKDFDLGKETLASICANFQNDMREGLGKDSKSSLAMIPSYVTKLPSGREKGTAYAIDLGGSNLRILKLILDGAGNIIPEVLKKEIPQKLQQGSGEDLFDFVADAVKELKGHSPSAPLGYTFSFPINQKSLNSGVLMKWTKNFTASGVVDEDVVALLNKSFTKKGVNLQVTALINDTVGTMLAGCYQEVGAHCFCGVILGTGSNCCYLEKVSNITKYEDKTGSQNMIINMECGNFGSRPDRLGVDLPLSEFDVELDNSSHNKNHQLLEKQISGMYLGEITRLVLRKYINAGLLKSGFTDKLNTAYKLTTEQMSTIVNDSTEGLSDVAGVLNTHGVTESTIDERKFVKSAAQLVGYRAAQLAAVQIAAIFKQGVHSASSSSSTGPYVAAIDGSVFEKYPNFSKMMSDTLSLLVPAHKIKLVLAKDGSGNGAALASVANA